MTTVLDIAAIDRMTTVFRGLRHWRGEEVVVVYWTGRSRPDADEVMVEVGFVYPNTQSRTQWIVVSDLEYL